MYSRGKKAVHRRGAPGGRCRRPAGGSGRHRGFPSKASSATACPGQRGRCGGRQWHNALNSAARLAESSLRLDEGDGSSRAAAPRSAAPAVTRQMLVGRSRRPQEVPAPREVGKGCQLSKRPAGRGKLLQPSRAYRRRRICGEPQISAAELVATPAGSVTRRARSLKGLVGLPANLALLPAERVCPASRLQKAPSTWPPRRADQPSTRKLPRCRRTAADASRGSVLSSHHRQDESPPIELPVARTASGLVESVESRRLQVQPETQPPA